MSWIKNLMKIFGSNESEEYDEFENQELKRHEHINGQMETKVTYQYPKGNFRFPLQVEDKRNASIRTSTSKINNKDQYQDQKQHQKPISKSRPFTGKTTEKKYNSSVETSVSSDQRERIQTKIKPKIKQPFRPTEIPSPVYGFNRPPKRNKEKNSNLLNDLNKEESKDIQSYKDFENETMRPTAVMEVSENNVVKKDNVNDHQLKRDEQQKLQNWLETEVPLQTEQQELEEEKLSISNQNKLAGKDQLFQQEQEPEEVALNSDANEPEVEEPLQEEQEAEEEIPLNESEVKEPLQEEQESEEVALNSDANQPEVEEQSLQEEQESEEEVVLHSDANESEVEEQSLQEEQESEEVVALNSDANQIEVEEQSLQEEQESEEEVALYPDADESDVEETNPELNEEPVRSHIPFNVIMLKKDRENLAKKQMAVEIPMANPEIAAAVDTEVYETEEYIEEDYVFPSLQLLNPPIQQDMDKEWLKSQSELLDETLLSFNVRAKVVNVSQGPSVTRFEVQPEPGVKVNKITNLSDDIKLSLAARDIRMEAPIPGKHTIGIELPNAKSRPVYISEIISSEIFQQSGSPLTAALGLDISGNPVITDLRKMPHGLIAGATGSGKSVCINSILVSLLYKSTPDELKLLMIDPKMVELAPYNYIPHLVSPVITDVKAATAALKWAVEEMERRYELFAHTGVREIGRYNETAEENRQFNQKLPFIVIVIDELADLMMMAPADVEEAICRIAQKARACGIHLIIATQRPSVDVITGLIKANVPTRIAFSVSSQVDSRTIIDISGAEKLLGRGDMLFLGNGTSKPVRLQGTYVSDEEIDQVVAHVRAERKPDYLFEQEELLKKAIIQEEEDEIFQDVCEFVMEQGAASTSLIQRNFRIGYNRAARLIEMMEQQGIISEAKGSKPRDILVSREELNILIGTEDTN
ncbi:DNA translocase FtsK [Bacillus sp. APMAM]|nr:DNA translocase FtsK [Bacillus sp. APMAM]RTZ55771.1 DNA translocase FtsK [Bacillus sp. SAJ1]